MDGDRLRDAYVARFSALYDASEVGTGAPENLPCYYILSFWDPEVPVAPVVYATFGAPGQELVVVSAAPISGLQGALLSVATYGPAHPARRRRSRASWRWSTASPCSCSSGITRP
jgi:hypothetical protein